MFTGIINYTGRFNGYHHGRQELIVEVPDELSRISIGESLAVNGVCLSLTRKERNILFFDLSQETLQKTTLNSLRQGESLNLEQSLTLATPLSGHLITGHIDGRGKILRIITKKKGKRLTISFPPGLRIYFIPKGSVAVNGVSLTIAELKSSSFDVELIPITLKTTNLQNLRRGDEVNLECDMIGKYVYNWISKQKE